MLNDSDNDSTLIEESNSSVSQLASVENTVSSVFQLAPSTSEDSIAASSSVSNVPTPLESSTPRVSRSKSKEKTDSLAFPNGITTEIERQLRKAKAPAKSVSKTQSIDSTFPDDSDSETETGIGIDKSALLLSTLSNALKKHKSDSNTENLDTADMTTSVEDMIAALTQAFPHQNRNISKALRDIPQFEESKDPVKWHRDFISTSKYHSFSTVQDRDTLLRQSLKGKAKDWLDVWSEENPALRDDPEEFYSAWKDEFLGCDRTRSLNALFAFRHCKKQKEETFAQYFTRVQLLSLELDDKPKTAEVIAQTILGLAEHTDIQSHLIRQNPKTIKDLKEMLKSQDEISQSTDFQFDTLYAELVKAKTATPTVTFPATSTPSQSKAEKEIAELKAQIEKLTLATKTVNNTKVNSNSSGSQSSHSSSHRSSRPQRSSHSHHQSDERNTRHGGSTPYYDNDESSRSRSRSKSQSRRHSIRIYGGQAYFSNDNSNPQPQPQRKPIRCHKCKELNHLAKHCTAPDDTPSSSASHSRPSRAR